MSTSNQRVWFGSGSMKKGQHLPYKLFGKSTAITDIRYFTRVPGTSLTLRRFYYWCYCYISCKGVKRVSGEMIPNL